MKIKWLANDGAGRSSMVAIADEYDAVPYLSEISIDGTPININGDRFAVAAFLAFGKYCGGAIEMPFPVSPTVAQAIEEHCKPAWTQVQPVSFEAKALPIGLGALRLVIDDSWLPAVPNTWGQPRVMTFQLMRSDTYAGTIASVDKYFSASNAWLFSGPGASPYEKLLPYLALAVLFSESWQSDTIHVPASLSITAEDEEGLRKLLESCRLGLGKISSGLVASVRGVG